MFRKRRRDEKNISCVDGLIMISITVIILDTDMSRLHILR